MTLHLLSCVECPRCHTRYIVGASPYRNGSYIEAYSSGDANLCRLFCPCSDEPRYLPFKLSELKTYSISTWAYARGYGSREEIVLAEVEKRKAS